MAPKDASRSVLRKKPVLEIEDETSGTGLFKSLGLWQLTAIGVSGIIGVGIFSLAGLVAHGDDANPGVGPAVLFSFLIAGLASAAAALSYAEFAGMVPRAGSAYTYGYVALGEIGWAVIRSTLYALGFLVVILVLGLVRSPWALFAVPAATLLAFAFAAVGMAATTWMRSWQDFEFVTLATLPMFLFSATFFPITAYPKWLRWLVEVTPLYRGVVLCRELTTGHVTSASLVSVVYLVAMGWVGLSVVSRRLGRLLLT